VLILSKSVSGASTLLRALDAAPWASCPQVLRQAKSQGATCWSNKRIFAQTEMTEPSFSSFLPIQHDGGAATNLSFARAAATGRTDCVRVCRCSRRSMQATSAGVQKHVPSTGQPITTAGRREGTGRVGGGTRRFSVRVQPPRCRESYGRLRMSRNGLCRLPVVELKSASETQRRDLEV